MRTRLILVAAAAFAAVSTLVPAAADPGSSARVSVAGKSTQANGDTPARTVPDTTSPAISLDGRWVAFSSDASNLAPDDTNGASDVFVRDLQTKLTRRASLRSDGGQANGPSYSPAMSVDGRWLAYVSAASNIVAGDDNGVADVFLADLRRGTVRLITRDADGPSNTPFVSLFGDWVTFDSAAENLAAHDTNGLADAFVYDRRAKGIRRVAPPAPPANPYTEMATQTHSPQISYDGRFVSYAVATWRIRPGTPVPTLPVAPPPLPDAPDVPGVPVPNGSEVHLPPDTPDEPWASDVFLLNTRTHRARKIKLLPWSGHYRVFADDPAISADGQRVVFELWSVVDADALWDYARPRPGLDLPPEVPADRPPQPDTNLPLERDALAPNPVDLRDIGVYDRLTKVTTPMSRNPWGLQADGDSTNPQISSQGHVVTFSSSATNLVPGDDNGMTDVFVVDTRDRSISRASRGLGYSETTAESIRPAMSYDGRSVVFASPSSGIVEDDTNGRWDVFLHDRRIDTPNARPTITTGFLQTYEEAIAEKEIKVRAINAAEQTSFRVATHDPDGDQLRHDILVAYPFSGDPIADARSNPHPQIPQGMTLGKADGTFRWTPTANQSGPWIVVFWVGDPRGQSHIAFASLLVRDARETAECKGGQTC